MSTRQRIQVVGVSGAGKTTLGRQLAERTGAHYVELDAIYHQPGWTPLPTDEFQRRIEQVVATERWVIDGNYQSFVGSYVRECADTFVWLDLPRWLVMARVTRRSLRRVLSGEELWNGNRETWRNVASRDPDRNIIIWTWTQYDQYRCQYEAVLADPDNARLELVRLRTRRDINRFLRSFDR